MPALPKRPILFAGMEKAAGLNQLAAVLLATEWD